MNGGPTHEFVFFGEPWPAVERYRQVPTPSGQPCDICDKKIRIGDQGIFVTSETKSSGGSMIRYIPVHRGCDQPDAVD